MFGVELVTPELSLLSGEARSVILRTSIGWLTVLDGHMPLIGDVVPCEVRVEQEDGAVVHLAVHGGFFEVDTSRGANEGSTEGDRTLLSLSTKVTLLAGIVERAEDIDVARAERSREHAEARLVELGGVPRAAPADADPDAGNEDAELVAARQALERAELRLSVARSTVS
jgi:F-type H+-transporting ATPase subunit epsilon